MRVHLYSITLDAKSADYLSTTGNGLIPLYPVTGLFKHKETYCNTEVSIEELQA